MLILAPLAVVAFGHAGSHAFSEPVMTLAGFPVISIALLVAPLVVALMAWMLFGGVLIPRKRAPALKQMNLNFFELQATYAWLCTLASPAGALLMAMLNAAKIRLLPVRGSGFGKAFLGDPDRRIETVPGGAAQTSAPGAMDVVWPPMWASLFVLLLHALVFGAIAYAVDRMATRPLPFKKAKLSQAAAGEPRSRRHGGAPADPRPLGRPRRGGGGRRHGGGGRGDGGGASTKADAAVAARRAARRGPAGGQGPGRPGGDDEPPRAK